MRKLPSVRLTQPVSESCPLFLRTAHTRQEHRGSVSPFLKNHLYRSLISLKGVHQDPRYHPEGDALYHSLQVFELAYHSSSDPALWAAALLHDIGKARHPTDHANRGAEELQGVLSPRIVWLIQHHLHLLQSPRRTRRWLHNTTQLRDLELLRKWDLQGRCPFATVMAPGDAINILLKQTAVLLPNGQLELEPQFFDWVC